MFFLKNKNPTNSKMSIIAFVLLVVYATWSWRILESYYYSMPCTSCDNFDLNENFDLEVLLYWNA